jgi:hypothetical protein
MTIFRNILTILLVALVLNSWGQNVSREQAAIVGKNYAEIQKSVFYPDKSILEIEEHFELKSDSGDPIIHIFNFKNGGFVLVSGDKRSVPVLAYSFDAGFDVNNMAPATADWLNHYIAQVDDIRSKNLEAPARTVELWNEILNKSIDISGQKSVNKLLTTRWNQDWPYNMYCPPHAAGPGGRVYAGCVASAMAQIMKYYDYPETGRHTHTYFWGAHFEVDFGETTYKWDSMTNVINSSSRNAIAELMFHCGVAVDMQYSHTGSGSTIVNSYFAMKHHFRYRSGSHFAEMIDYETSEWKFKLKEDLDRAKPILYRGISNQSDGHAYVVDGYQDTSYFHFNWGWGGWSDGFYHLDAIHPQTLFPWGQAAVFNTDPYYADYCNSMVYTQPAWTFDDGSGPNLYFKNTSCEWLISLEDEQCDFINLSFNRFEVLEGDFLKIYDGNNEDAPLLGEFSGLNIPNSVTSSGNEVYLKFETTSEAQARGWELSYESVVLGVNDELINKAGIFPNPVNDYINIHTNTDAKSQLRIYDIYGRLHFSKIISGNSQINLSHLADGVYFVIVKNNNYRTSERIMLMSE